MRIEIGDSGYSNPGNALSGPSDPRSSAKIRGRRLVGLLAQLIPRRLDSLYHFFSRARHFLSGQRAIISAQS